MKLDIVFENEHFIVVNKPSGLLSIPDRLGKEPSLKILLLQKYGSIFVVHRLDKETSGLIIFAKSEVAHRGLSNIFNERTIIKEYLGIVYGMPQSKSGIIDVPIKQDEKLLTRMIVHPSGSVTRTQYEVIEHFRNFSLMKFNLLTGRTHQIRVHCKYLGHPLLCDALYGNPDPIMLSTLKKKFKLGKYQEERPLLSRLALHAHRIAFTWEQKPIDIEIPLPKDLSVFIKQSKQ
ncbi:MAG: RluA family pseudouridine synthase [Phycisphaerales bacterium]|nr:RluA family pseudouridine synthase [Phycisphaerales bacterium]